MRICLNPSCQNPDNPDNNKFCHGCGANLAQSTITYDFQDYRIIKIIGQGGFGRTYLAEQIRVFDRQVVIKKLIATEGSNTQAKQIVQNLFEREAKKLSELEHPQIPEIYDYFSQENSFYLVQKYIEGENLLNECKSAGRFSEEKIEEILNSILPVLVYLQKQNILHRDIKPENIMRRRKDGTLFLIDFGAVKEIEGNPQSQMTRIFTPGYAAREHIMGRPRAASDIYSLGATCIRLLTGCLPLGNQDVIYNDDDNKWTWREYVEARKLKIKPKLAEILDKMVTDSLRERYPDAQAVIEDLSSLKSAPPTPQPKPLTIPTVTVPSSSSVQPKPPTIPTVTVPSSSTPISRGKLLKLLTALGGGALAFGGISSLFKSRQEQVNNLPPQEPLPSNPPSSVPSSPTQPQLDDFPEFSYEVVKVNRRGEIIETRNERNKYQRFDLGKGVSIDFVYIPGGKFTIGSPESEAGRGDNEGPQTEITLKPFWLGKYPVTQAQYQAVIGKNPARFPGSNRPVEKVSWDDAVKFCEEVSKKLGKEVKLPSESQWEYACRAGTTTPFYFGETITSQLANYNGNYTYADEPEGEYREETTEVGIFPPNAFGLYDMHGNVWEWCEDDYENNYENTPRDGSAHRKQSMKYIVLRGGSWVIYPHNCRSADRFIVTRDARGSPTVGFRIAYVAEETS